MKGSEGITTDVNIYFINYEMKKHVIKTNWWYGLNQIAFIKWMHVICLIDQF